MTLSPMRTLHLRPVLLALVLTTGMAVSGTAGSAATTDSARSSRHYGGFLVWSRFDDFETGTARLVVAGVGGDRVTPLTHPAAGSRDIDPRISPDGRRILFERDTPEVSQAWMIGVDGRDEHQIDLGCVDPCAGTNTPSWTPDGRHLLYDRVSGPFNEAGDAASALLWKADLDGGHNVRFSEPGLDLSTEETDASFAPAGYMIVLHGLPNGHSAVFRLRADSTHPRQLTPWSLAAAGGQLQPLLVPGRPPDRLCALLLRPRRPAGARRHLGHVLGRTSPATGLPGPTFRVPACLGRR